MSARATEPPRLPPSRPPNLVEAIVVFGRLLRSAGFDVAPGRTAALIEALEHIDLADRRLFRSAARAILVGRRDDLDLFDRAFELFWSSEHSGGEIEMGRMLAPAQQVTKTIMALVAGDSETTEPAGDQTVVEPRFGYSDRERLRLKNFADLTESERRAVARLIHQQPLRLVPRRTRRRVASRRGDRVDLRRSLHLSLRSDGEALELAHSRRKTKPRPLVVLADVSGSMEPYARLLLQFVYAIGRGVEQLEAFAFGTRLTRLTRALDLRDVDRALAEATAQVVDWGGGTRIGDALRRFNVDWGRRVLGRGAVVMIISDGWDRGETGLLASEIARLSRSAGRLIWLNPLIGTPGYEPRTRGMLAALPFVDDFLPVHNLRSLEQLARTLESIGTRSPSTADQDILRHRVG